MSISVVGYRLTPPVAWKALEGPGAVDYVSSGRPWRALEGSSPQGLQGPKAYKYSVPVHCRIDIKSFLSIQITTLAIPNGRSACFYSIQVPQIATHFIL